MQDKAKPPVPPRGGSTSNRSSRSSLGEEGPIYQNRISVVPSYGKEMQGYVGGVRGKRRE